VDGKVTKQYSFQDWIDDKFFKEDPYGHGPVCNDSENYLLLVQDGKMTYEELNKIQDAQRLTYDYLINMSIEQSKKQFKRLTRGTLDLKTIVGYEIEKIEKYIQDNKQLHYDVLLPRRHRGMKIGAKYIIPSEFIAYRNNKLLDIYLPESSKYSVRINGTLTSFPTIDQLKYRIMEERIQFLTWLRSLLDQPKQVAGPTVVAQSVQEEKTESDKNRLIRETDDVDIRILTLRKLKVLIKNIPSAINIEKDAINKRIRRLKDLTGLEDFDDVIDLFELYNLLPEKV